MSAASFVSTRAYCRIVRMVSLMARFTNKYAFGATKDNPTYAISQAGRRCWVDALTDLEAPT